MTTTTDPTTMTMDEYRAAKDREDGRGHLHHYGTPGWLNRPINEVVDYTVRDGVRVAVVESVSRHYGKPHTHTYEVPLAAMFATKKHRPLGFKPVPWC